MAGYSYSLLIRTSFWVRSASRALLTCFVTGPSGGVSCWVLPPSWPSWAPAGTADRQATPIIAATNAPRVAEDPALKLAALISSSLTEARQLGFRERRPA